MTNQLTQYTKALTALTARRDKLQAEVDEINALLKGTTNGHAAPPRPRPARSGNKLTLREAISQVVKGRALTKQEILAGIQRLGYKFSTNDPAGSLNALLYSKAGKRAFHNDNGKFSVR